MKLSFMTFVCPEWDMEKAVRFAKEAGYDGIEIRVDAGHKHNVSSQSSAADRKRVKKLFKDMGIAIPSIATSVNLAYPDQKTHRENVEAAKANLTLAADLGAPVVRIFAGGRIPNLTSGAADQVAAAFDELGEFFKASGVCPMLECRHDIIVGATEADEVFKRVKTRNFGALWNHSEMDDATFAIFKNLIRHVHIHEEVRDPNNTNIVGLAKRMKGIGYKGYISLEIIENKNLPENELRAIASRLQQQIRQGEAQAAK
jgi:sugar phosphate isomerase/epimerase